MKKTYEEQVREQIDQYVNITDIHALPAIFHDWSHENVSPGLEKVFGVANVTAFYVEAFLKGAAGNPGAPRFLSLGCGDGSVEIGIGKALLARGVTDFRFVCFDLSDVLLERFRAALPTELADNFELVAQDLNSYSFGAQFDAVMANHSLHHMVDLEGIFSTVFDRLSEHGVFATNDMIGRNGHQRWPETRVFVDFFWPLLTQKQRVNVQLKRLESTFVDFDCSGEGFEGVRAQDILAEIASAGFNPWKFFGFGGVIDVFVDRGFGHGFDPSDPNDIFLIKRIGELNEILLDSGVIKPTMMLAYFVKQPVQELSYRGRTMRSSIRPPETEPRWLAERNAGPERAPDDPEFVFKGTPVKAEAGDPSAEVDARLLQQEQRIQALEASTSWRVTAPLRALGAMFKR